MLGNKQEFSSCFPKFMHHLRYEIYHIHNSHQKLDAICHFVGNYPDCHCDLFLADSDITLSSLAVIRSGPRDCTEARGIAYSYSRIPTSPCSLAVIRSSQPRPGVVPTPETSRHFARPMTMRSSGLPCPRCRCGSLPKGETHPDIQGRVLPVGHRGPWHVSASPGRELSRPEALYERLPRHSARPDDDAKLGFTLP